MKTSVSLSNVIIKSIALWLMIGNAVFAEVYSWEDEHGNVVYGDDTSVKELDKSQKVETIKVKELNILSFPAVEKEDVDELEDKLNTNQINQKIDYQTISITSPSNDASIRQNDGVIRVSVSTTPSLGKNDSIKVTMNGSIGGKMESQSSFIFSNIDRGSHTLQAKLYDSQGKLLLESKIITFHLHRFSAL